MFNSLFLMNLVGISQPGVLAKAESPTLGPCTPAQCPTGSWSRALALGPEKGLGWPHPSLAL